MLDKTLKPTKVAIFSTRWCYCEMLLVFAKYKGFYMMTPGLLFYVFKVKYANIYTENIMIFSFSFPLEKLYKIIS